MKREIKESIARHKRAREYTDMMVYKIMAEEEMLDEDGYPTVAALDVIEKFPFLEPIESWFDFIEDLWYLKSFGWVKEVLDDGTVKYYLSTAGWSGNESIIRSMEKNHILWSTTWESSRRGGHHEFEFKESA